MYCKLTNKDMQTHAGCQWVIGEWKETSGEGELCSNGWLHAYTHPLLAVFFNPIHANIQNPKLFEIEVAGKTQEDYGLKIGFSKMRLIKEIPLPQVTYTQRIVFGILCGKEIEPSKIWQEWADNWLNNKNKPRDYDVCRCVSTSAAYYAVQAVNNNSFRPAIHPANIIYYAVHECRYKKPLKKPLNLIELAEKAMTYN